MAFKPFRPPSLKNKTFQAPSSPVESTVPPAKRIRLSPEFEIYPLQNSTERSSSRERQPLLPLRNVPSPETKSTISGPTKVYYSVLWRKFTAKKNKTWDDDGVAQYSNGNITLYDSRGHQLGASPLNTCPAIGLMLSIAGREVEIADEIGHEEFAAIANRQPKKPLPDGKKSVGSTVKVSKATDVPKRKSDSKQEEPSNPQTHAEKVHPVSSFQAALLRAQNGRTAFKQPLKENNVLPQIPSETPIPRHSPDEPNALVFKRPKRVPQGKQIVDVVLDPILGKHLRDHQREGIKFLYECVMDMRDFGGQGCILADDMGLGKTLQTIALLWTLMKQNPVYRAEPVIRKALIVCPVTLVQNWKKEFRKWLGRDRLGVMAFDDKGSRLSMFDGKNFKVMIVGYERLRTIAEDLTKGAGIDIIVCDEGHRLKTLQNKSAKAIETLNTTRRIILSGTPIQNDLSEFFAMANFVNDGVLGTYKSFVKDFEKPIMKSRQPNATEEDIERGQDASNELASTTSPFILRRTADILSDYLPPKTEYVLFCKPTPEQSTVYRQVLQTPMFQSAMGSNDAALQMITILKKLCNSPALMRPQQGADNSSGSTSLQTLHEMLPAGMSRYYQNSYSSKIRLLDELLHEIRNKTDDKVVLVSNYTSTLNLMENLLVSLGLSYRRLDGSVPNTKRHAMVDEFNRASSSACFAFLLSAKAGGVGINLIGGNRLILFDVDWNPATDDQAMARIHREGQRKPCKIYRFLIKGGLEERIWQRQVVKRGLADSILDNGAGGVIETQDKAYKGKAAFSREELRDLFRLDERNGLQTHDLIGCNCEGKSGLINDASACGSEESSVIHDVDEYVSDSENDYSLPDTLAFVKASVLTEQSVCDQERKIVAGMHQKQRSRKKKTEQEMQELMTYTHIDTSTVQSLDRKVDAEQLARLEETIDDPCLAHVLTLDKDTIAGNIAYVFKKTASSDKLGRVKRTDSLIVDPRIEVKREKVDPGFFST